MEHIPNGTIVMFSGKQIPDGWFLCDGDNDTPNLIDRFILGGKVAEDTPNSRPITGSGDARKITAGTNSISVDIKGKTKEFKLEVAHLPSHYHTSGIPSQHNYDFEYGNLTSSVNGKYLYGGAPDEKTKPRRYAYTSSTGEGSGHQHDIRLSTGPHDHTVDITPPYYVLAFIMFGG